MRCPISSVRTLPCTMMLPRLTRCSGLIKWDPLDLLFSSACGGSCCRRRLIITTTTTSSSTSSSLQGLSINNGRTNRLDRGGGSGRMNLSSSSSSSSSNHQHNSNNMRDGIHDGENPFMILGIPKTSTYDEVKRRFLELALQYHPDLAKKNTTSTNNNNNNEADDDSTATGTTTSSSHAYNFIRFRQAFEVVRRNSDGGGALLRRGNDDASWTDEEFQAWFYEETGHADVMFHMELKTRKEVIDVADNQSQGGLDRGGMWEMARSMAELDQAMLDQKSKFNRTVGVTQSSSLFPTENTEPNVRRKRRT